MVPYVLAALLGYLIGSIPTGALVARLYGGVDLTKVGSKRTGATNVLRTLGPVAAALVLLGDISKGVAAVLLCALVAAPDAWTQSAAGLAAVLGHAYSPFLGFKGGRGVATGLGGLLALSPPSAGLATVVGIVTIAATRYVSLGSILGTLVGAGALAFGALSGRGPAGHLVFALGVGTFIVVAHHDNIERLLHGTERRLGERVEQSG